MRKYLIVCFCISVFTFGWSQSHQASAAIKSNQNIDTSTRYGLGYDVDLNGITFRIGPTSGLRFDISFGFGIAGNTGGGPAQVDLTPGFRILFPIITYKSLLVQGVFGTQATFNVVGDNPNIGLSFFGGIMPEFFILPRLSIEILFGLAFNLTNITGNAQISVGTVGEGISIVSGAAFHWYF